MDASPSRGLFCFLAEIPDPRSRHGRQHSLSAVLGLVCCAVMCGARGYAAIAPWAVDQDIAFMHRLGFTRRPPKLGGIRKVLIALSPTAWEGALTLWAETLLGRSLRAHEALPQACALDGNTAPSKFVPDEPGPGATGCPQPVRIGRGSRVEDNPWHPRDHAGTSWDPYKTARGRLDGLNKSVHLLSLVAHESRLTVAQTEVAHGGVDKTNEHKAALRLLEGLVLEGRLITGDAMSCQRDLSQKVLDAEGHDLWWVKDNQPTLLADIQAAFAPSAEGAFSPSAAANLA